MRIFTLLWLCGFVAARAANAEEFFLTGLVDMGEASRAMIYSLPSARQFTLKPGEEAAGIKLVRLDSREGFALARMGTNWLHLRFSGDTKSTNGYGKFLLTGDLPPDFAGKWPDGYQPKIIRDHQAGLLPLSTNKVTSGSGETASAEFVAALRSYAKTLSSTDRQAFLNELQKYSAPSSDNGFDANAQPKQTATGNELMAAANFNGLSVEASQLLRNILASPAPALGEFMGRPAEELRDLREILRAQRSTLVIQRLQQQLSGYASPPSGNGAGEP